MPNIGEALANVKAMNKVIGLGMPIPNQWEKVMTPICWLKVILTLNKRSNNLVVHFFTFRKTDCFTH